jgi:ribonuclease-3
MILTRETPGLPTLPAIQGDEEEIFDLNLALYSHPSLLSHDKTLKHGYGDTERLYELGKHVLQLAVTQYYFQVQPLMEAAAMVAKIREMTHGDTIHRWLEAYNLKARYTPPPEISRTHLLADHNEMEHYFCTLVGAYTHCNGVPEVNHWIRSLLALTDGVKLEDEDTPMQDARPPDYAPPPVPPGSPPPPNQNGAQEPLSAMMNCISLAYVNEMASKQKVMIDYHQQKVGKDHNPQWTVRCTIDGVERGSGTSAKTKDAKLEAARRAFMAMGWMQV